MSGDNKQRLRPWLEAQINGCQVEGLEWINTEKTRFKIPWRHGGTQNWTEESSQIFMEWAKHTGRYREGIDEPDWVAWKTRLRCALHKASDIIELKDQSRQEIPDSYRVYEFKPHKNAKKSVASDQMLQPPSSSPFNGIPLPTTKQEIRTEALIPTCVNDYTIPSNDEKIPSDLKDISISELIPNNGDADPMNMSNVSLGIRKGANGNEFDDVVMISEHMSGLSLAEKKNADVKPLPPPPPPPPVNESEMLIKIIYGGKTIVEKTVTTSDGCHLYYGSLGQIPLIEVPQWMHATMYGKPDSIHFPCCEGFIGNAKQEDYCQKVLEKGLSGGLLLKCYQNDIYAYRLCQCSIFYVSNHGTNGAPVKLNRDREDETTHVSLEKIFDYENTFLPALTLYRQSRGPRPDPNVYLLLGAQKTLTDVEKKSVLMYVTVATQRAVMDVTEAEANPQPPSLQFSTSDDLDLLLQEYFNPDQPSFVATTQSSSTVTLHPSSNVSATNMFPSSDVSADVLQQAFGVNPDVYDPQFMYDTMGGNHTGETIRDDWGLFPGNSTLLEQDEDILIAQLLNQIPNTQQQDQWDLVNSYLATV